MLTVPLFVEILRTRPQLLMWTAAITQAMLWTIVPALLYSAPPGQLPEVIAVGHEFQFGSVHGPPLAYWLAELAYRAAGMFGVYLLSQVCVVVTYWAVFTLGRRLVGASHAALAVLLMTGVFTLTILSPEFGPSMLATPLWAVALLLYWQAVGKGNRRAWLYLSVVMGLLLLTTYAGLILLGLLLLFTFVTERGRAEVIWIEPWIAGVIVVLMFFPHLIWLDQGGSGGFAPLAAIDDNVRAWAALVGVVLVCHVGLIALVLLAGGVPFTPRDEQVPVIARSPVDPFARTFVYFFAFTPAVALVLLALFTSRPETFVTGPLVVLSGLAAVAAAGDRIRLVHHRVVGAVWAGLLLVPPLMVVFAIVLSPWAFGPELRVAQPAGEMGRFFGDSFARRTGRPLAIVAGDERLASLVAMAAPSRPDLFLDATPERSPWVTRRDIEEKGAIVLWHAADQRGLPPAAIRERFPDLVPEVPPRGFERRFQGRLPLLRIGWAVIRPRAQPPAPATTPAH
jgi:hypothetical protein